jgi:anti-sigma regulatory factor (Ser/Thr protein kinase)
MQTLVAPDPAQPQRPTLIRAADIRAFPGTPESASLARSWVAGFVPGSPAATDAALMTSELFTNAILYSASRLPGGVVLVSVRTGRTWIRVDVIDQGEIPPCLAAPLGQGLEIVRQLADVFGADGPDRWFSLRLGGAR